MSVYVANSCKLFPYKRHDMILILSSFLGKVFKPRSLVDLVPAISSALLINESQWVGIIIKPMSYSLKGAVLHIDTGPGLIIEQSHGIEIEKHTDGSQNESNSGGQEGIEDDGTQVTAEVKQLSLQDGKIELPDWASDVTSVLWIPVRAVSDGLPRGIPAGDIKYVTDCSNLKYMVGVLSQTA